MSRGNWATGDDRRLIRFAMKVPMLDREEEGELALSWQQERDEHALKTLTEAHLRLAIAAASKYRHYGLPVADLIQEGTVGLMEAAYRFEPERDVRFSTYASWWVRAAVQDYVLRNWSIVRTGTTSAHKALFFNLKRLKARMGVDPDRPLSMGSRNQIADEMGVRLKDVEAMEGRLSGVDRSLNAPVADESAQEWQDLLVSESPRPDQEYMENVDGAKKAALIEKAMGSLTERESFIIRERQLREEGVTLAVLGSQLGISKERVRQLEAQALGKLKQALIAEVGDPRLAGLAG
ncbi:RNA polymerase factor sigma-32 [Kordiimonas lacus]|uniref:RNA polymerase, sigma 32 subunit, RpoH n=1 Tax=Kordiimonas lacus TaxID=637679 RepID=A0A1G6TXZ5_9PROT|nr:RNA polymerase factor sigma-32 [Kordiimonas lacus]SDD33931.1 RNA polymerase, sigma 32 subunit, RpoH [Kordiimonas lacus]